MTPLALAIVLVAAVMHATWNLASKRVANGVPFIWLTGVFSVVLWTPVALIWWWQSGAVVTLLGVGFMVLSGLLHSGYSLFLQRAYRTGDFSLVYPIARGTGPFLSALTAIVFLGERPTPVAGAGMILIIISIIYLTGGRALLSAHPDKRAIGNGIACGAFIAAYTVADRQGLVIALVPPLLLDWGGNIARTVMFAPFAAKRWPEVIDTWRRHKLECATVAILGPAAYILILWAMTFSPLSYIAPAREVSILIGAYIGARILKEGDMRRRVTATIGMIAGVIALSLG